METRNWINVLILGFGFFLIFSAFQTTVFIQTLTITGYLSPECQANGTKSFGVLHENFANKVGYYSGAIIYLMVSVGNWASVSIVAMFGAKWSLIVSGSLYIVYIACLIRPLVYTVFIGAFLLGAGGGVLWTAQGQILIQNSSKKRMATTSGIFWLMLQMSLVVGSIYLFLYFYIEREDANKLQCFPHKQNNILFSILTFAALLGLVVLLFISPKGKSCPSPDISESSINSRTSGSDKDPIMKSRSSSVMAGVEDGRSRHPMFQAIINALRMLATRDMFLLAITFVYTGYELNYWSGVFGTVIGRTHIFPRYYVGMALFFIGLGEIIGAFSALWLFRWDPNGGGLFGIFGSYTNRWGRDVVILMGFLCHMVVYLCSFLFFPNNAISVDVDASDSYGALGIYGVFSNVYATMVSAFLLGFGDACFNTQIYSLIGTLYQTDDQSAPAMALYKFFQSIAAMVGFFTSTLILLQWQLLALVILAVLGSLSFCLVEWKTFRDEDLRRRTLNVPYEDDPSITSRYIPKTQSTSTIDEEVNSDSSVY